MNPLSNPTFMSIGPENITVASAVLPPTVRAPIPSADSDASFFALGDFSTIETLLKPASRLLLSHISAGGNAATHAGLPAHTLSLHNLYGISLLNLCSKRTILVQMTPICSFRL